MGSKHGTETSNWKKMRPFLFILGPMSLSLTGVPRSVDLCGHIHKTPASPVV